MSSLVINAATLDDDYNNGTTNNYSNNGNNGNNGSCRKNQTYKNKTTQKIDKTMLHQLYTSSNNNESEETMGDFVPVQKQMQTANLQQGILNNSTTSTSHSKKKEPSEEEDDVVDKINTDATYENELYKQYIHNYNQSFAKDLYSSTPSTLSTPSNPSNPLSYSNTNNDLLKRLDKILYLLEEEKNDQSHLITEELILYVFLGVFIIYVLDSFVRAGKYVR
jgi:hypothetical protein